MAKRKKEKKEKKIVLSKLSSKQADLKLERIALA